MVLNIDKCKIIHLGKNNPNRIYNIENENFQIVNLSTSERSKDGKFRSLISKCISNANRKLGMLRNTFEYFIDFNISI